MKTVRIKKSDAEQHEVTVPHYTKIGDSMFFKVYSEENCVNVSLINGYEKLQVAHSGLAFGERTIESNKEEFEAAFNSVLETIKKKAAIEEWFKHE